MSRFRRLSQHMLVAAVALCSLVASTTSYAQPALFAPAAGSDISPSQQQTLTGLYSRPTTSSVELIRVDASALLGDAVALALPGVGVKQAAKRTLDSRGAADYTWIGDIGNVGNIPGRAILVVKGDEVTGAIESPTYRYSILSLGGGLHALIKVDQSKFPPDHPASYNPNPPSSPAPGKSGDAAPKLILPQGQIDKAIAEKKAALPPGAFREDGTTADPIMVDVMVAWSPNAATAYGGNMASFAQLAVNDANTAYTASNANVVLRLVDTYATTYNDTGKDFDAVLNDLMTASGTMATVRSRRDTYGADLVGFLFNNSSSCGLAAAIQATAANAYMVAHYDCAVSNHSFAHEFGHLFGARHDPFVDNTNTPFAYGHGYITPSNAWRTIMAYVNGCGSCPRLGYFSNPSVTYNSLPMGTAAGNDNARVHRTTVATVAGFRNTAVPTGPANDNFANAIALPGSSSGSATGTNVGATKEAGEPSHSPTGNAGGKSVWWTWVAPFSGPVTFYTAGSNFDTLLGIYTGSSVGSLTAIAKNDDFGTLQSGVHFTASAGTTYRIAVDGFYNGTTTAEGTIALAWRPYNKTRDFGGDGKADLLWRDNSNSNFVVSQFNGATISSSTFIATLPSNWSVVGLGDFGGDDRTDILWRDASNGNAVVSTMNGASITSSIFVANLPLSWIVAGVGDFNGDGKADILWRDTSNGNLVVSIMNGASIVSSTFVANVPLNWSVVGIGDFNGDGKADILWRDNGTSNFVVSIMNGASIVSSTFVANLPANWIVAGVGDFNGDGKADILWRDQSNGNAVVSLMNGPSIVSSTFVATLPLNWIVTALGDVNNDGKADIFWRDQSNGNLVVSIMNGTSIVSSTFAATLPLNWTAQNFNVN